MEQNTRPHDPVGLCRTCGHARIVQTPRSRFWLCRLSATDPRFERYPRLPILRCEGFLEGVPEQGREPDPA